MAVSCKDFAVSGKDFPVKHVISFRRPGQKYVLTKMTIPPQEDPEAYVHRLENLGYTIVDVLPPLPPYGPPENPLAPNLRVIGTPEGGLPSTGTLI
jgi:hypothetical protein